jgi:hypothetical protein
MEAVCIIHARREAFALVQQVYLTSADSGPLLLFDELNAYILSAAVHRDALVKLT